MFKSRRFKLKQQDTAMPAVKGRTDGDDDTVINIFVYSRLFLSQLNHTNCKCV